MKFTQQEALVRIKSILGQSQQVSDRTITDTLETLMPIAGEETELDAFITTYSKVFSTLDGNVRKEKADFVKSNPPVPPTPPTPVPPVPEPPKPEESAIDKLLKAVQSQSEQIAAFQKRLDGAEAAKTAAQRKTDAFAAMKAKFPDNVIDLAGMTAIDWNSDTAATDFETACTTVGSKIGVKPQAGGGANPQQPDWNAIKELSGIKETKQ